MWISKQRVSKQEGSMQQTGEQARCWLAVSSQLRLHWRALHEWAIACGLSTLAGAVSCAAPATATQARACHDRRSFSAPVAHEKAVLTQAPLHSIERAVQVGLRALVCALHCGKAAAVDPVIDLQDRAVL